MPRFRKICAAALLLASPFTGTRAEPLQAGQAAPRFQLTAQDGTSLDLATREGKGWTVLYFYPKAGTPGCTTQACAFRDGIQSIRALNADVFGISTDATEDLAAFHRKHRLNFTLLSDPDAKVTNDYGVKLPVLKMAKRWTFVLDPKLIIRHIDDQVDPALDAKTVAETLQRLQAGP